MHKFSFRFTIALTVLLSIYTSAMAQSKGFDTSRMNTSADACDDFFEYANGTWVKNTQIPASQPRWGSFNILQENNRDVLKSILETAVSTRAANGTDTQLIGDFYFSCMDEASIEKAGATSLKPYFKKIDKVKSTEDLQALVAYMHNIGLPAMFSFGASPDLKNSSMNIASAGQGGLTLPNRDYYTNDDAKSVETRQKFIEYVTNMFKLIGDEQATAAANAKTVMDIQTRLAKASLTPVERRNPANSYNKITVAAAQEMTPNFSWANYMTARGVTGVTEFNVGQPAFFKELNSMLKDVSINDWKTYMRLMVINSAAPALSKNFVDENFNFFGKYLQGTKEQQPRWKKCVQATDGSVGEALGQEYVRKSFTPEAKKRMDELITNVFAAMKDRINGLEWMSDQTKAQAQVKLAAIKRKIGYPDVLRGYKGLELSRKSFFANSLAAGQFQLKRNLLDVGKPVDKTRWGMTTPTVNAYYSGQINEIVFPAGILQPPFFNFQADDAINYGAIGGVIGHEISHGFDDQGSKFDAEGNFKSWWTDEDRKKFDERASCVVRQFDGYEVLPGLHMKGALTLGENIGDLGGLNVAYTAYQKSLEGKSKPEKIDNFTAEQRFFLGWAQVWAAKATEEFERFQVNTDPHAIAKYRVNGPMSNMPQFAEAFGCKTGDKMVRSDFCKIW
jgi:putative endopeptidase